MNIINIMFNKINKINKGQTLLEAIMAVMILAIGFAGVCAVIVQTSNLTDMARDHYIAINLCKNRIEKARILPYSLLLSLKETNVLIDKEGNMNNNGNFRRTTIFTPASSNLMQMTTQIDIKNRFTLQFTTNENEYITTYLTNY